MTATASSTRATGPHLAREDLGLLLAGVRAFRGHELDPRAVRPEVPLDGDAMAAVATAAQTSGLIGDDSAPLWGTLEAPGPTLSLASLATLAEASAGAAFHLHQLGLGGLVGRLTDTELPACTVPSLDGRAGLARGALARLVAGRRPHPQDPELLAAHYPADGHGSVLLQAADPWELLVLPRHGRETPLTWVVVHRGEVEVRPLGPGHGLDGLLLWDVTVPAGAGRIVAEGETARRVLRSALTANALALVAVGLGSLEGSWQRAWRYSGEREQGGQAIRAYPAVQRMLADARSTISLTRRLLSVPPAPDAPDGLVEALALRARLHPLLCDAASALLQVFGGYGYMRDHGAEGTLRDNQHLKLSSGSPGDLAMFLIAAEPDR